MTVLCRAAEVPAGYEPDNKEPALQLASNEAQELWLLQLPHEAIAGLSASRSAQRCKHLTPESPCCSGI